MNVLRSLAIAFSLYSRIPMPQFIWKEEDMKYTLCFFPWVGAVIGGLVLLWDSLCRWFGMGDLCRSCVMLVIPLWITGGFHADGYMDTSDALSSYQPKERKLEILKDSHIGAFAVIRLVMVLLVFLAAVSELRSTQAVQVLAVSFYLARVCSGLAAVNFRSAKHEGMLFYTASNAARIRCNAALVVQLLAAVTLMCCICVPYGLAAAAAAAMCFGYYRWRSYREFGGITGDLAGYFVVICECGIAAVLAVMERVIR